MEAPLVPIDFMRPHYQPHEYPASSAQEEDERRRRPRQPASYANEHELPHDATRDRHTIPPAVISASTNTAYSGAPSHDYRSHRSAFTSYAQNQPQSRHSPSPSMSTPGRAQTHGFEGPSHYQTNPSLEPPYHQYPGYPAYEHPSYYYHHHHPDAHVHHPFGSPYQPWQPEEQSAHPNYPNYPHPHHNHYPQHNYHPDHNFYSYTTSTEHPEAYHRDQPPSHYRHPDGSPPISHASIPDMKETPSAMTDATTPSTAARGGGLNLSPYYSTDSPSQEHAPIPLSDEHLDDRKPSANPKHEENYYCEQPPHIQGILKKPPPHLDFEPIPFNQFALPPSSSPLTPSTAQKPSPPRSMALPTVASTSSKKKRSSPQYRYASIPSSGSSSTSEGSSWNRRYTELLDFKQKFGHCNVPQNYSENTSLGIWVNKQRMEHKMREEGKQSSLNDSRLGRLQNIGFQWAKRKGQASWDEKFNELAAYQRKHGNCHVPTKYKDNTALGRWVSTQRAEYKKYSEGDTKTPMNPERIARLESIGFAWFMAP